MKIFLIGLTSSFLLYPRELLAQVADEAQVKALAIEPPRPTKIEDIVPEIPPQYFDDLKFVKRKGMSVPVWTRDFPNDSWRKKNFKSKKAWRSSFQSNKPSRRTNK